MNKSKLKSLSMLSIFLVSGVLILGTPVLSHAEDSTVGETQKTAAESRKAAMKDLKDKKCELITSRVDERVGKFDNNKGLHQQQYAKLKERLSNLITKLNEKGYDTSKLSSDLSTLNSKIEKFGTDYKTFTDKLKESRTYVCGASEGQFKTKLEEAKDLLKVVKQDSVDVRNYFKNTIKPDLQDLKNQRHEKKSETTTDTKSSN